VSSGYDYTREQLADLVVGLQFPERTVRESALIVDFLLHHRHEYDTYSVSVRVGAGTVPDPTHLPGVQRQTVRNSQMRIDLIAFQGAQPFIFEVKQRAIHAAIGQLRTYRRLWMEEHPDAPEPALAVIARTIEPDMVRVYADEGITVYLYPPGTGDVGTPTRGVSADDETAD
jgi:hypothetical protein